MKWKTRDPDLPFCPGCGGWHYPGRKGDGSPVWCGGFPARAHGGVIRPEKLTVPTHLPKDLP